MGGSITLEIKISLKLGDYLFNLLLFCIVLC